MESERGQTELIGTVLLAVTLVVAVAVVGFFLLERQAQQIDSTSPDTEFSTEFKSSTIDLSHLGGERFLFDELDLILSTDSGEFRFDLETATKLQDDGDDFFENGERVRISHSVSVESRILLVDSSANGFVLYDETKSPNKDGDACSGCPTIETFDVADVSSGDDAIFEVDWRATDDEDDITSVDLELINSDSGVVEDSTSVSFSETGDTGTTTTELRNNSGVDELYEVRITVTDAGGNTTTANEFDRSDVDTTPPVIGNFSATNPQDKDIKVSFESDEELGDINVTIVKDSNNKRETVLKESDFSSVKEGNYTYTATYTVSSGGTYNATLYKAKDLAGNDGADGQFALVSTSGAATPTPTPTPKPELKSVTVSDKSKDQGNNNEAAYDVDFEVNDDTFDYDRTEITFKNTDTGSTTTKTSTNDKDKISYSKSGAFGDSYEITVKVYDTDDNVVDKTTITDDADGTDP